MPVWAVSRTPGTLSNQFWASKTLYGNVPANTPDVVTNLDVWTPVKLQSDFGDKIQWLWFNGVIAIDNLKADSHQVLRPTMNTHWLTPLLATALVGIPAAAHAHGQHVSRLPGELVAAYAREAQSPTGDVTARRDVTHIMTHHTEYTEAEVNTVLQGLEDVALSSAPARSRAQAALLMATPGSTKVARPLAGVFPRLAQVYDRTTDPLVRSSVIAAMGLLADRRETTGFLEVVAKTEPPGGLAGRAVASLDVMGDEGRAALKRLHDSKAMKDSEVQGDLERIANNGYRMP